MEKAPIGTAASLKPDKNSPAYLYQCFRQLQAVIARAATLREAMQAALVYLAREGVCPQSAIWALGTDGRTFVPEVSVGLPLRELLLVSEGEFNGDDQLCLLDRDPLARSPIRPGDVFRLELGGRTVGFLWALPSPAVPFETVQNLLKFCQNALAARLGQSLFQTAVVRNRGVGTFLGQWQKTVASPARLEKTLPQALTVIATIFPCDYLALTLRETGGNSIQRYAVTPAEPGGSGLGSVLLEKGKSLPVPASPSGRVLATGETLVREGFVDAPESDEERFLRALSLLTYVVLPLREKGAVTGTLLLATRQPRARLSLPHRELLSTLSGQLLTQHRLVTVARRRERLLYATVEQAQLVRQATTPDELAARTCTLIAQELPVSFCRIWRVEAPQRRLWSIAFSALRNLGDEVGLAKRCDLADLPWHALACEERKIMRADQSDLESLMPEAELRRALLPGVQKALLVPIISGDRVTGLIAVGDMRSAARRPFTADDEIFLTAVANQMAFAFDRGTVPGRMFPGLPTVKGVSTEAAWRQGTLSPSTFSTLYGAVANPLSAILGSVELLRLKQPELNPQSEKYLQVIERGAWRIKEMVEQPTSGAEAPSVPASDHGTARRP